MKGFFKKRLAISAIDISYLPKYKTNLATQPPVLEDRQNKNIPVLQKFLPVPDSGTVLGVIGCGTSQQPS